MTVQEFKALKSTADASKAFASNGGGVSSREIATISTLESRQIGPTLARLAVKGRQFVRAVDVNGERRWLLTARGRIAAEG